MVFLIVSRVSFRIISQTRNISLSSVNAGNKTLAKQGKIFNKLISVSPKKKRKFFFDNCPPSSSQGKLNLGHHLKGNKENNRRIAVLNSLFIKHISDLLVTGNFKVDVLSKGLEISKVSMNSNFNQLNVFWGTNNVENLGELEAILPDLGYSLRHELSQLGVMGVVPRIVFIKDKHYGFGAKIDYLLQIADYGEDHESVDFEPDFIAPPMVQNNTTKEETKSVCGVKSDENEGEEESMPIMRQDTFNLDHDQIMKKILKRMQKARAMHRFQPNLAIESSGDNVTSSEFEVDNMMKEERKEALAKFILSRRILREKKNQNKHKTDEIRQHICVSPEDDEADESLDDYEDYIEEDNYKEEKL